MKSLNSVTSKFCLFTLAFSATPAVAADWEASEEWRDFYDGSFGPLSPEGDEESRKEVSRALDGKRQLKWAWPEQRLLVERSSLPLAIEVDEKRRPSGDPNTWPSTPSVKRQFALGACRFSVENGPWSVARWQWEQRDLVRTVDALPAASRIYARPGDEVYLQLGTELVVEIPKDAKTACKKRLEGKTVSIGRFDLSGTGAKNAVILSGDPDIPSGDPDIPSGTPVILSGAKDPQQIYLFWRQGEDAPALFGRDGPHPWLESQVLVFQFQDPGVHPVRFSPVLGYVRVPSRQPQARRD